MPYTGSGVLASALAMDKGRSKIMYDSIGLKTAPWVIVRSGDTPDAGKIIEKLGEKVVVKAARGGSSIGTYIVEGEIELTEAIHNALEFDNEVVVESFIPGTETTVAVLGNAQPEALPVIEIVPQGDSTSYDFTAKYAEVAPSTSFPHVLTTVRRRPVRLLLCALMRFWAAKVFRARTSWWTRRRVLGHRDQHAAGHDVDLAVARHGGNGGNLLRGAMPHTYRTCPRRARMSLLY